ncbi:hypothetical protein, partial [Enterocloster clostridioformis]|uniref:hypothetical protein n=1 Tax=Enterocloster clostridioformis TaxID=1531 RepID=UPI001A9940B5
LYLITVACVCQQLFSFFYFLLSCAFGTHRSARDILPDASTNVNRFFQLFSFFAFFHIQPVSIPMILLVEPA